MHGSLLARLEFRLASALGLQGFYAPSPWICYECRPNARRQRRGLHMRSSLRIKETPYVAARKFRRFGSDASVIASVKEEPKENIHGEEDIHHLGATEWPAGGLHDVHDLDERKKRSGLSRLYASQQTQVQNHNAENPQTVRKEPQSNAPGVREARIADLTNPCAWRKTERATLATFREFLNSQHEAAKRMGGSQDLRDPHRLNAALRRKDHVHIIAAVLRASDDHEYLQTLQRTVWAEIFTAISPVKFGLFHHRIHRSFNPRAMVQIGYNYRTLLRDYVRELGRIVDIRMQHGIALDLADYRILLTHLAQVGDEPTARRLWSDMKRDNVRPDLECYNRYMEAIIFDENARLRQASRMMYPLPSTERRFSNVTLFKSGSSDEINRIYLEMLQNNIRCDTASYCVLMTAFTRDGRFNEAQGILETIWRINVELLMEGNEIPVAEPIYQSGHPLEPTPRLLVTVAEVFGSVNRIPAGFRVLDYISRQYQVPLKPHIWYQLYRWTWMQARLKEKHRALPEEKPSQLDIGIVNKLLATMGSEPYNVDPDMDMLHLSFLTAGDSPWAYPHALNTSIFLQILQAGRVWYMKALNREVTLRMRRTAYHKSRQTLPWTEQEESILNKIDAEHTHEKFRLQKYRALVQRWAKFMIRLPKVRPPFPGMQTMDIAAVTDWRLRGLPNFVAQWGSFVPNEIKYWVAGGRVEIRLRNKEELAKFLARKQDAKARSFVEVAQRRQIERKRKKYAEVAKTRAEQQEKEQGRERKSRLNVSRGSRRRRSQGTLKGRVSDPHFAYEDCG